MEYIYAALLIHKAGQKVEEASVKKVLEAAGVKVDGSGQPGGGGDLADRGAQLFLFHLLR